MKVREIKFRGKLIDRNEWAYGYYHLLTASNTHCIDVPMQDFDQSILWHVKAETVGQFTGRSDKNGKDIYEGDICRLTLFDCNDYGTQYRVVVRWLNGAFYFANEDSGLYVCVGDVQDTNSDVEVIGNIYDDKLA